MGNCLAFVARWIAAAQKAQAPPRRGPSVLANPEEGLQLLGDVEMQLSQAQQGLEDACKRQDDIVREIRILQPKVTPNNVLGVVKLTSLKHKLVGAMKAVQKAKSFFVRVSTAQSGLETHAANLRFLQQQQQFSRSIGAYAGVPDGTDEADEISDAFEEKVSEITERTDELESIIASIDPLPADLDHMELNELLELCEPPAPPPPLRSQPQPPLAPITALPPLPPPQVSVLEAAPAPPVRVVPPPSIPLPPQRQEATLVDV